MTNNHPLDEPQPFDDCPSVKLTDEQIGRANRLAEQTMPKPDNYETFDCQNRDYVGMSGELAFAKYYDLEFTGYIENGGDPGYDYKVMGKNKILTVDVKTSAHHLCNLFIQKSKIYRLLNEHKLPDAYCLIEKRLNLFGIVGFMWSKDVTDYDVVNYKVPSYFIPREELKNPAEPEELTDVTDN